jgi:hypothetical protein
VQLIVYTDAVILTSRYGTVRTVSLSQPDNYGLTLHLACCTTSTNTGSLASSHSRAQLFRRLIPATHTALSNLFWPPLPQPITALGNIYPSTDMEKQLPVHKPLQLHDTLWLYWVLQLHSAPQLHDASNFTPPLQNPDAKYSVAFPPLSPSSPTTFSLRLSTPWSLDPSPASATQS